MGSATLGLDSTVSVLKTVVTPSRQRWVCSPGWENIAFLGRGSRLPRFTFQKPWVSICVKERFWGAGRSTSVATAPVGVPAVAVALPLAVVSLVPTVVVVVDVVVEVSVGCGVAVWGCGRGAVAGATTAGIGAAPGA